MTTLIARHRAEWQHHVGRNRPEPGCADDRGHGPISAKRGGFDQCLVSRGSLDPAARERVSERLEELVIGNHRTAGLDPPRAGGKPSNVAPCRQRNHVEPSRISGNEVQG